MTHKFGDRLMTLGEFYSLACAFAWALAIICFRVAADRVPAAHLNVLKNSLMLALLWPTMVLLGSSFTLDPTDLWISLLSGFLGIAIGDTLYLSSLKRLGASRAGIAGMMYSPWVILLSGLWLGETLRLGQWLGLALVLLGLGVVALAQNVRRPADATPLFWSGLSMAAVAMLLMATGIVMVKPVLERAEFMTVVWFRLLAGLLPQALLLLRPSATVPLLATTAWAGVRNWPVLLAGSVAGTYVAMTLWLAGYKLTQASVASVLNESAALWIMLLAWIVLGERLNRPQVLGALVLAAGVLLMLLS